MELRLDADQADREPAAAAGEGEPRQGVDRRQMAPAKRDDVESDRAPPPPVEARVGDRIEARRHASDLAPVEGRRDDDPTRDRRGRGQVVTSCRGDAGRDRNSSAAIAAPRDR